MATDTSAPRFSDALRRRWWVPVLCALVAGAGALYVLSARADRYQAQALMRFSGLSVEDQILGTTNRNADIERVLAEAVPQIDQDRTAVRAIERLRGNPALGPDQIQKATSVEIDQRQGMVAVKATRKEPQEAARIANAYARGYVDLQRRSDRQRIQDALDTVESELAAARGKLREAARRAGLNRRETAAAVTTGNAEITGLSQRRGQLQLLANIPPTTVAVARAATPPDDTAGIPAVILAGGAAVLGFLLGLGLVAIREGTDRRLRRGSDFERAVGAPVLARVPDSRALRRDRGKPLAKLRPKEVEPFRLLAAQLRFAKGAEGVRSVVVTSLADDDSGPVTARYLAEAVAATGARTLYIGAVPPDVEVTPGGKDGLEDVLRGTAPALELIRHDDDRLDLLARHSPNGLYPLSHAAEVRDLVQWGEHEYDMVVVNVPPLALAADAVPFARSGDVVVVACRNGTPEAPARALRETVESLDVPVAGVVVYGSLESDHE